MAFPLLRPWGDKAGTPQAMADAFASPAWTYSHLLGALGFALLTAAVVTWARSLTARSDDLTAQGEGSPSPRAARSAAWWLGGGTVLVLPYYGAETFALNAVATYALESSDYSVLVLESAIRQSVTAQSLFGAGLLSLTVGGVLLARAAWSGTGGLRWSSITVAVLIGAYLPQFLLPEPIRIMHGVALGISLVWWAFSVRR